MMVHYWKEGKKMVKLKRKSRMIFWFFIGIFAFLIIVSLAAEQDYRDRKNRYQHKHIQKFHKK
jgi:CHASE3 domain sensor protein